MLVPMGSRRVKFFNHDLIAFQKGDFLWKPFLKGVVGSMSTRKRLPPVHHRVLFKISLQMIASCEEAIEKLNEEIDRKMEPYIKTSQRLQTILGVKKIC
jgi:hypothetical protein